jgi:hypothetical protein
VNVLGECERAWAGADTIPKRAVMLFLDFSPGIEGSAPRYNQGLKAVIFETASHIEDTLRRIVDVEEN